MALARVQKGKSSQTNGSVVVAPIHSARREYPIEIVNFHAISSRSACFYSMGGGRGGSKFR